MWGKDFSSIIAFLFHFIFIFNNCLRHYNMIWSSCQEKEKKAEEFTAWSLPSYKSPAFTVWPLLAVDATTVIADT